MGTNQTEEVRQSDQGKRRQQRDQEGKGKKLASGIWHARNGHAMREVWFGEVGFFVSRFEEVK